MKRLDPSEKKLINIRLSLYLNFFLLIHDISSKISQASMTFSS